jgi:dihydrofolate reductase
MRISAIFAMSKNRVIGKDNQLPWRLPADMQHFKSLTMGKPILLGRKTYESIGHALPDRCNLVMTRDIQFQAPGCIVVNSLETALSAAGYSDELMVIGGAVLYQHLLPRTQRLYMTLIDQEFEGDAFFPRLNEDEWQEVAREDHVPDEKNPYSYSFITLDRRSCSLG